mmetsp:Transcript_109358/g.316088  ORF Transcript_109358/g.316088 Transcript_109358/m.316088 type:complete len:409 (-) Transcript_109358:182-1408(-)
MRATGASARRAWVGGARVTGAVACCNSPMWLCLSGGNASTPHHVPERPGSAADPTAHGDLLATHDIRPGVRHAFTSLLLPARLPHRALRNIAGHSPLLEVLSCSWLQAPQANFLSNARRRLRRPLGGASLPRCSSRRHTAAPRRTARRHLLARPLGVRLGVPRRLLAPASGQRDLAALLGAHRLRGTPRGVVLLDVGRRRLHRIWLAMACIRRPKCCQRSGSRCVCLRGRPARGRRLPVLLRKLGQRDGVLHPLGLLRLRLLRLLFQSRFNVPLGAARMARSEREEVRFQPDRVFCQSRRPPVQQMPNCGAPLINRGNQDVLHASVGDVQIDLHGAHLQHRAEAHVGEPLPPSQGGGKADTVHLAMTAYEGAVGQAHVLLQAEPSRNFGAIGVEDMAIFNLHLACARP